MKKIVIAIIIFMAIFLVACEPITYKIIAYEINEGTNPTVNNIITDNPRVYGNGEINVAQGPAWKIKVFYRGDYKESDSYLITLKEENVFIMYDNPDYEYMEYAGGYSDGNESYVVHLKNKPIEEK